MTRTFLDEDLVEWEAYVSGGQPDTPHASRIFFVCREDPFRRPRWVPHASRDVAATERELQGMDERTLLKLLADAQALA
ncbi:MAG: hypothetical protein ACE5HP_08560 [Gemmatimonadota bacterium]